MKTKMKFLVLMMLLVFTLNSNAQKPEPVYSIVRQEHSFDWYEQQAIAWKQEISRGTNDAMAWVYWYEANRMARNFCDSVKWESKKGDYFVPGKDIVEMAEKAIPNSFELNFLKTSFYKADKSDIYLLKAQEMRPYDNLLFPFLTNNYIFKNDKQNLELTCKKWFESNETPQEILTTAYNMLVSLDQNAILITYGDNDTYPCIILQNALKIRPDVQVIGLGWTRKDEYVDQVCKESGVKPFIFGNNPKIKQKAFFKHLVENTNRSIYASIFTVSDVYKDYEKNMYLTGLTLKYSPKPFNNLAELRNNVENKFMLDFLKQTFNKNNSQSVVFRMNNTYLYPFQKLYEYYKLSGENDKAKKLKELAVLIARKSRNPDYYLQFFEK